MEQDMARKPGDSTYMEWISTWRRWKSSWCESRDTVVSFTVKAIVKGGNYTPNDHANFVDILKERIGHSRIEKDSTITISTECPTPSTISCDNLKLDEFGILTYKLSFFSRREILQIVKCIEIVGNGVIHDGGRILSIGYNTGKDTSLKSLPYRDDPVWNFV